MIRHRQAQDGDPLHKLLQECDMVATYAAFKREVADLKKRVKKGTPTPAVPVPDPADQAGYKP